MADVQPLPVARKLTIYKTYHTYSESSGYELFKKVKKGGVWGICGFGLFRGKSVKMAIVAD